MDKNGSRTASSVLGKDSPTSILYGDPLLKAAFLARVVRESDVPVYYLDFDLMYTGLVMAGMLKRADIQVYRPDAANLQQSLQQTVAGLIGQRSLVVVDSVNGLHNVFDGKDAGRLVNAYAMFLEHAARSTGSQLILACMARTDGAGAWTLSPTGRRLPAGAHISSIRIRGDHTRMMADLLGGGSTKTTVQIAC